MTKKLEEEFNLPSLDIDLSFEEEPEEEPSLEEVQHQIEEYKSSMTLAERVDASLPVVEGLDQVEREIDEYAVKAMNTFDDLCDLGKNVEDRNAAAIYDSASKMLGAALQAKQAKIDKKLKMIELQQRQAKLELEQRRLEHQIQKTKENNDETDVAEGKIIGDRSALLAEIMNKMRDTDK
jgi:hypothetical protein